MIVYVTLNKTRDSNSGLSILEKSGLDRKDIFVE